MGKGTAEKIRRRISKLRDEVDQLRYRYHVQNDPQVTDEIYTSLRHELAQWEGKYPKFKSADSPTARIAGKSLAKFKKITHLIRQWSLDDAFDEEELNDWENKNKRILKKKGKLFQPLDYLAEVKIDGLHIILTYRRGILKSGATRGDGIVGEDVTQNIKTIESVPLVLKEKVDLVAEGECWLSKQELGRINRQREKKGEALFANARNAAAGSIRQLNPAVAASRRLDSFIYQIHPIPGGHFPFPIKTQIEKLKVLEKLGFKVNPLYRHAKDLAEIAVFFQKFGKKKRQSSLRSGRAGNQGELAEIPKRALFYRQISSLGSRSQVSGGNYHYSNKRYSGASGKNGGLDANCRVVAGAYCRVGRELGHFA